MSLKKPDKSVTLVFVTKRRKLKIEPGFGEPI